MSYQWGPSFRSQLTVVSDLQGLCSALILCLVQRDLQHFSPDPETFLPERWIPNEGRKLAAAAGQDYILIHGAYMPFKYGMGTRSSCVLAQELNRLPGPGNCVGRALALHEMRAALAMLVRGFDVQLAPSFAPEQWTDGLRDEYIVVGGKLEVVLAERVVA